MPNTFFQFKQFLLHQDRCAMKVTTDGCLFGAWVAEMANRTLTASYGKDEPGVLDIGTGTGLLSLMFAQKNRNAIIEAIEIDEKAAEQARENAGHAPWSDRIHVVQADVKEHAFNHSFDIIISNPPFYEKELTAPGHRKNIAHHGEGLLLEDLFQIIQMNLAPEGRFFVLLPFKREKEILPLLTRCRLDALQMVVVKQSTSHAPFRVMVEGTHCGETDIAPVHTELSIRNEINAYTPEFKWLLDDFYL